MSGKHHEIEHDKSTGADRKFYIGFGWLTVASFAITIVAEFL